MTVHKPTVVEREHTEFELCCYHNQGALVQVIRSTSFDIPHWHLERVVFPGQRLMFYAPSQAQVQVCNSNIAGNLLSDTIPCDRLHVSEG